MVAGSLKNFFRRYAECVSGGKSHSKVVSLAKLLYSFPRVYNNIKGKRVTNILYVCTLHWTLGKKTWRKFKRTKKI